MFLRRKPDTGILYTPEVSCDWRTSGSFLSRAGVIRACPHTSCFPSSLLELHFTLTHALGVLFCLTQVRCQLPSPWVDGSIHQVATKLVPLCVFDCLSLLFLCVNKLFTETQCVTKTTTRIRTFVSAVITAQSPCR